jgi:hypothetical protein
MKRIRHTPEQVINKLREAETMLAGGRPLAQVLQHLGVSELIPCVRLSLGPLNPKRGCDDRLRPQVPRSAGHLRDADGHGITSVLKSIQLS